MPESAAADRLATHLAGEWSNGRVTSVTWLNHHTALELGAKGLKAIASMAFVGIDGLLLLRLLGGRPDDRTSADLVLPRLLPRLQNARIALVGTTRPSLERAAQVVADRLLSPSSMVVDCRDGFDELPARDALQPWLRSCRPDVVIVGLGAGVQEQWALDLCSQLSSGLVVTCGGFLDQLNGDNYYPEWAYRARLNWAVRLTREPGRLWRRYSIEALHAVRVQRALRREIECLAGFRTYRDVVSGRAQTHHSEGVAMRSAPAAVTGAEGMPDDGA